jgi:hypothetical protein
MVISPFTNTNAQIRTNEVSDHSPLHELTGYAQRYFYSTGQEARAEYIASFIEEAGDFYLKEVAFVPRISLYILGPEDWKDYAAFPLKEVYGFPHNIDSVRLVVASSDNDFWRSFIPPLNSLPPHMASRVSAAYGNPDGTFSMMPFFDLLALHEMGHSYTAQGGLKMHRYWMGELFVNIMLHTYVAEEKPELLPALETFPDMVIGKGSSAYTYTSLEDFEMLYPTLGMGPENYGWYQSKLHSAAKDIFNSGGKEVMNRLWAALKKHQEEMTDEEFIEMLRTEVHPSVADVFVNW